MRDTWLLLFDMLGSAFFDQANLLQNAYQKFIYSVVNSCRHLNVFTVISLCCWSSLCKTEIKNDYAGISSYLESLVTHLPPGWPLCERGLFCWLLKSVRYAWILAAWSQTVCQWLFQMTSCPPQSTQQHRHLSGQLLQIHPPGREDIFGSSRSQVCDLRAHFALCGSFATTEHA